MYFNFLLFSRLVERAHQSVECSYSLEDALSIFRYYFQKYEDTFCEAHPNIRIQQIARIIEAMPYIDSDGTSSAGGYIAVADYEALIARHFQTKYQSCDYNINHFFSGDIRLMRYYEELH